MSCDQTYPFPQVFLVDGAGGEPQSGQIPNLVPCWSFPPAQERVRSRRKSNGCMGISHGLAVVVLLLFLLVFAALGFGAYQIYNMQTELRELREVEPAQEFSKPEKQIGFYEPRLKEDSRAAAHVIGKVQTNPLHKTLRWEPQAGQAFTAGGVAYLTEDGSLQVNETGLYHIYSRVELIFTSCSAKSSFDHSVFLRRAWRPTPLTLMVAHRAGFCSQHLGQPWTTESYLGSALQLQKYDKISVNVSHPIYLSHEHYANFFGLYKV